MATKKKTPPQMSSVKILIPTSMEFRAHISPGSIKTAAKDLERGELCLSACIDHRNSMVFFNIYADQVEDGELIFSINNNFCDARIRGTILKEINPNDSREIIESISNGENVYAEVMSITDSDGNDYSIDGDDKKRATLGVLKIQTHA